MSYNQRNNNGFGMTTREALGEKVEMQGLNTKLADYIDRVRALKKSAAMGLDPRDYQESMRQLESEVLKLKQLYEDEINKLRRKLHETQRKNDALEAENERNANLGKQLIELSSKAKRLEEENQALQRALAQTDKELRDLKEKMLLKEQQAAQGHKWSKDNEQLRRDMNEEVKRRQAAEAAAKQSQDKTVFDHRLHDQDKTVFDHRLHDQQLKELQERVRTQNDIISALEKRLKALSNDNGNLPSTLQKLRESNQVEMKKFQKETEDALNRNMDALKRQMEEDKRAKGQMLLDAKSLEDQLRAFAARNEELEGQNKGLKAANSSLQQENDNDRIRSQNIIRDMEKKLQDLQNQLMDHSKEFVNARDAQASLRNEIDTYRVLLDQEGQRLQSRNGNRTPSGKITPNLPALSSSRQNTPKHERLFYTMCGHTTGGQEQMHERLFNTTSGRELMHERLFNTTSGLEQMHERLFNTTRGREQMGGNSYMRSSYPNMGGAGYHTTYRSDFTAKQGRRY